METVAAAARIARRQGVRVILNPAPAAELPEEVMCCVDVLTPNYVEAVHLAGVPPAAPNSHEDIIRRIREHGVDVVVMTLGKDGAMVMGDGGVFSVPGFKVTPVDATGAGDGFNAGLGVALARDPDDLQGAVRYGNAVGALVATRLGAQPSLPRQSAVEALLSEQ
jgi:ribokinase